jgi:hypothetical protein
VGLQDRSRARCCRASRTDLRWIFDLDAGHLGFHQARITTPADQPDHSSPQTWTTWPGVTSRYWRTGGW